MPPGVKEQLGLSDPKNPNAKAGSTEQADKFKAAFLAASAPINECLQYTAAHAEQTKHDPQASKRDTTCQAYQVALGKIDPTNPSAAQGAIDQVLAGVQGLKSAVEAFKAKAEQAFKDWTGCEGEFNSIAEKIREMLDWGDKSAAPFEEARAKVQEKANQRAYEDSFKGLKGIAEKIAPRYEEMLRQKAAKEEYDPAFAALQPRLEKAKACTYKPLQDGKAELESSSAAMCELASIKDYVSALQQLSGLTCKVDEFESKVAEHEEKKNKYEEARKQIDPKLSEASQCQHEELADLDQKIVDLSTKSDATAQEEKYDEAVCVVDELSTAVEEKLTKKADLEAYKAARETLDPKLTEASQCQHEELADLDQKIADLTSKMDAAVAAQDFKQALQIVGELSTVVDEKISMKADIEAYKAAREALNPKLTEASQCQHEELADLDQKIADLTSKMDAAVTAKDFKQALQIVNELSAAVDEKIAKKADVEAYKTARAAVDPKIQQAAYCSKHEELAPIEKEIEDLKAQLDKAVAAKDFKTAATLCSTLSAKIDSKLSEQGRLDRQIVGSAQKERADKKLEGLDEETRKRYNAVADAAKSPEERDYISKALASGHSIDDIEAFAKKINGKDKDWLQNNLKLTGSTTGKGVKQQWGHSCNATTAQALKGELDPLYSLKLHEENADVTDVDESDGTKKNAKLAAEQKAMLEGSYSGGVKGGSAGVAANRVGGTGGKGRWADDLENNMSDSTGVKYTTKLVDDGGTYKVDDAVKDVDAGLKKGHPVPLVVGASNKNYQHYVLVTGKNPGPPETWTIHDPWDGVTVTRSVQDIKDGKLNVANCSRITGMDNPATKE